MSRTFVSGERRRYTRAEVVASCRVFSAERQVGSYVVRDLSAGGACLVGDAPLAPGHTVRLVLELPRRAPLGLAARVMRTQGGPQRAPASRFAVQFLGVSAEDEDAIHQGLMAELERLHARRYATVLIVDQASDVREALERDLRELGKEAVVVSTPLEAVGWLVGSDARFDTAVVDLSTGAGQGVDVLDFLTAEHPQMRRVVLGDEQAAFRLELAVRSGRAHASLRRPWNRADLIGVLRIPAS